MTHTHTPTLTPTPREQSIRVPVLWGLAFGAIQAASPLAIWWLDQATVQALLLALIAAITLSSSYEPARATAGHVPGAAPVRPCSRPWAMFAATVVAMPSQDDSHIPARRSFASKRAG